MNREKKKKVLKTLQYKWLHVHRRRKMVMVGGAL